MLDQTLSLSLDAFPARSNQEFVWLKFPSLRQNSESWLWNSSRYVGFNWLIFWFRSEGFVISSPAVANGYSVWLRLFFRFLCFTSDAFWFCIGSFYDYFFHRCRRKIAIFPDHCLVFLPLRCFCRSRESRDSAVAAVESFTVFGCLIRLNPAVAEGHIFCGSTIVAAKTLNFSSL